MNCYLCKNIFDELKFTPRLLIVCGHSLCENCIIKTYNNGRISCPDCHTINIVDSISFFPKNLALLHLKPKQNQQTQFCAKHNKKYEAYCEKDKELLCISCILEDGHRNHPVQSLNNVRITIKKAYIKEKDKLQKLLSSCDKMYQNINQKLYKIEENIKQAVGMYEQTEMSIDRYFSELKKIIYLEEENLKNKNKDLFSIYEKRSIEKQAQYNHHLQVLDSFIDVAMKSENSQIAEFLETVKSRDEFALQLNIDIEQANAYLPLQINKNTVCESIVKSIDKFKNKELQQKQVVAKPQIKKVVEKPKKNIPSKQNGNNNKYAAIKKPLRNVSNKQKKPSTQNEKQIPKCELSGFEENPYLFKSFLSSNASFFLEKRNIYHFGGFCEESNSVVKFNVDTLKWEQVTSMTNRSKFGIAVLNKEIFLLGGKKEKQRISSGEIFCQGKLTAGYNINGPRSGFGIVVLNEQIHLVGGNDGQEILKTCERFNRFENRWEKLQCMNESRDELSTTVGRDGKIYAIGGFGSDENICLKTVERYDPYSKKWEFVKPMITQRRALSAVTLADGIYAIGGFDGQNYLNTVEKYDQYNNGWTLVSSMNQSRCTHTAVAIFETQEIYVFGGFDYSPLSSVERYSVVTDTWQTISQMPIARFMHGSIYLRE